jgi:hypothetical protein
MKSWEVEVSEEGFVPSSQPVMDYFAAGFWSLRKFEEPMIG